MGHSGRVLWVVAVPAEARAVCLGLGISVGVGSEWELVDNSGGDVLVTGVGKANAAGAVARAIDLSKHSCVVSAGVGGALSEDVEVGAIVLGRESVYGDEGVETDSGLIEIGELGFAPGPGGVSRYAGHRGVVEAWEGSGGRTGVIATVSSGAGTDELRARRGGFAMAEAMEGASVLQVATRLGVAGLELRAISNTTGRRAGQRWDLDGALVGLSDGVRRLDGLLRGCGVCG